MSSMTSTETLTLTDLDAAIESQILGSPMAQGRKFLGIEMEFLVLHRQTAENAPLAFCRGLMADLAADLKGKASFDGGVLNYVDGGDFSLTMEPGGQLEIATTPRSSLGEIEEIMQSMFSVVDKRLAGTDYHLVSLGHAPVTKVEDLELLPRTRYKIMNARMPARGRLTRNMMRATAGFQLAYDVEDKEDAGRKLALLYRLSPVLLAITANSRQIAGKDSGFASYRHNVWLETDKTRTGVPAGILHAETAVDGYIKFARQAIMLFLRGDEDLVESPEISLQDAVAQGLVSTADLSLHLSSLFPHVRPRNYLEVRCFDAVDWKLARSVLALLSGLIYCKKATAKAEILSERLVLDDPTALQALHLDAAKRGLDAQAPDGTPFRKLARELVGYAKATIGGPECQWAELADMQEVERHIG